MPHVTGRQRGGAPDRQPGASIKVVPRSNPSLSAHDAGDGFFVPGRKRKGNVHVDDRQAPRDPGQRPGRHRGQRGPQVARRRPRCLHGQEGRAHGRPARHGSAQRRRAPAGGQARQRGARGVRGRPGRPQGGPRGRRDGGARRRGGRGRHAARPRQAARPRASRLLHHRRDGGLLLRHRLSRHGRPARRDGVLQLHGPQHPGRPPQPLRARHVLRRGRVRGRRRARHLGRHRRVQRPPAHADLGRAGAHDGDARAAHLHDLPRPGVPPRRGRPVPPAAVPPGGGPRRGQGHHVRRPEGHAGRLHQGHVRPGPQDALPPALLPVHGAVVRGGRLVRRVPRQGLPLLQEHGLARDPRLRHGGPERPVHERHRPGGLLGLRVRHRRGARRLPALRPA